MSAPSIAYVAVVAQDTARLCRFLGDALGLERTELPLGDTNVPFFGIGSAALAVFEPNARFLGGRAAPGVHHIALAVEDPERNADRFGLPAMPEPTDPSGSVWVIEPRATFGVPLRLTTPLGLPASGGAIERIDHVRIATPEANDAVSLFVERLGCPLESTETDVELRQVTESFVSDKYGAVYHSRAPEIVGGLRATFVRLGDCDLALVSNYDPTPTARDEPGIPQSSPPEVRGKPPADNPGAATPIHHIALRTENVDSALAQLSRDNWRLIDHVSRPGARASRIGHIDPGNFGGGPDLALMTCG